MESLRERLGDYLVRPELLNEGPFHLDPNQLDHHYKQDGDNSKKSYPSVTTVLNLVSYNEFIVQWANSLGFRRIGYKSELQRTAKIGTALHAGAQSMIDPELDLHPHVDDPLTDYYMRKRIQSLRERLEQEKPWRTIFTETTFCSREHGFAGTIDWFVEFRGMPTLADFKSSSGMREKQLLQLGGYYLLLTENGIRVDHSMILLCKEHNCEIHHFDEKILIRCGEIFLRVLEYYYDHAWLTETIKDNRWLLSPPTAPDKGVI